MFGPIDTIKTTVCLVGTIISALCTHFVHTKLKLNEIIQWQLLGMTIHHFLAFGIQVLVFVSKYIFGSLTKTSCTISFIWGTSLLSGCQVFSSAISLSRFYMTWSTKRMKYARQWIMIASTVFGFCLNLALLTMVYTLQAYFEMPGLVASCSGFEPKEGRTGWIILTWILIVAVSGVIGDLGLIRFLKAKQNETSDVQLVPWKVYSNNTEQYKATIPVRATLISFLTTTVFIVLFMPLWFWIFSANRHTIDTIFILWLIYACLQLPLIIGLTVKLNQKKVAPMQPPQQLTFHD